MIQEFVNNSPIILGKLNPALLLITVICSIGIISGYIDIKKSKKSIYFLIALIILTATVSSFCYSEFESNFLEYSKYKNIEIKDFHVKIYKQDSEVLENKIIYRCSDKTTLEICVSKIKENLKKDLENGIIK